MRSSNVLITFAALVMGALAAFLAVNWLRSQSQLAGQQPTQTVVVASSPLAVGSALSDSNTSEIPWAAAAPLPDGAFTSKKDLLKDGKRLVLAAIERNEPVLRTKITAPGQSGSLSSQLDADKRAVTVSVDDVRGVAGLIRLGDRVDVVLIRSPSGANNRAYSDIILQNVKVLALDQSTSDTTGKPTVAKAVTLEVTPEEAQKVLLAANIGRLSLVLRQSGNSEVEASKRVSDRDLALADPETEKKTTPVIVPAATAQSSTPAPAPVVEKKSLETTTVAIVRGMKREEYTVVQDDNSGAAGGR
ncbi:MAG: Flp pilus assembly protein CpaB [Xanthobacteraceae bacterium]